MMIPHQWTCPPRLVRGALSVWLGLALSGPAPAAALRSAGLEESNVRDEVAAALNVPSSARHQAAGLDEKPEFGAVAAAFQRVGIPVAASAWGALPPASQDTLFKNMVARRPLQAIAQDRDVPAGVVSEEFREGYEGLVNVTEGAAIEPRLGLKMTRREVLGALAGLVLAAKAPKDWALGPSVGAPQGGVGSETALVGQLVDRLLKKDRSLMAWVEIAAEAMEKSFDRRDAAGLDRALFGLARSLRAAKREGDDPGSLSLEFMEELPNQLPSRDAKMSQAVRYDLLGGYIWTGYRGSREAIEGTLKRLGALAETLSRTDPFLALQLRRVLQDPDAFTPAPDALDDVLANEIGSLIGPTSGDFPDNRLAVQDLVATDPWRFGRILDLYLTRVMDPGPPGVPRDPFKMVVDPADRPAAEVAIQRFWGNLPKRLQAQLRRSSRRIGEVVDRPRQAEGGEPVGRLEMVPQPLLPLAERIAGEAGMSPARLRVTFDAEGRLVTADLVTGDVVMDVSSGTREPLQALFPLRLRASASFTWALGEGGTARDILQRLQAPGRYAHRDGPLHGWIAPDRIVILGPSMLQQDASLRGVVGAFAAKGFGGQVIILSEEASDGELARIADSAEERRDKTGGVLVTAYGDDLPTQRLRGVLEARRLPVRVRPGRPAALEVLPVLRQLFLDLGVPETVATPEAVQEWLPAAGLEEAA